MENKKRAMVVDDSKLTQKQLAQIFSDCGIDVIEFASNGAEALEKYNAFSLKPDIVTLDITMPVMDGITALKKILDSDPSARVLMVSAIGKENVIRDCMQTGARNFIVKPFHPEKVREIIRNVVTA